MADLISPCAEVELLRFMATRADFAAYKNSLPILGVDGSLADTVPPDSPARGKVYAKTGTRGALDLLHGRPILLTKALAGYITTASNKELTFAVFVGPAPVADINEVLAIGRDLGRITEVIYGSQRNARD